jgi:hypothetical protein
MTELSFADENPPAEPRPADAEAAPKLYCASLPEFLDQVLFPLYRRKVGGGRDDVRWCEQWWKHAEAIARLDALWRAWEHLRLDPATGISVWFRDHADPHMAILLSEHGPFANCQLAHAHRDTEASHQDVPQLPSATPPPGLLT